MTVSPAKSLKYNEIINLAEIFLKEHHSTLEIPIPIEDIIELGLGIKITSYNGLKKNFDIDGFLTGDCSEIVIDNSVFVKFKERARFTLAHELGHRVLHKELYEHMNFKTPEDVVSFQNAISEEQYGWYEYQANVFAAGILVPTKILKLEYENAAKEKEKINKENEFIIPYLEFLPSKFEVSSYVLIQRARKEKLLG